MIDAVRIKHDLEAVDSYEALTCREGFDAYWRTIEKTAGPAWKNTFG
jgi:hypothetical protein